MKRRYLFSLLFWPMFKSASASPKKDPEAAVASGSPCATSSRSTDASKLHSAGARDDARVVYPLTTAEEAACLTSDDIIPTYPELHLWRYGANADGKTNNDSALTNWTAVIAKADRPGYTPGGNYLYTLGLKLPQHFAGFTGDGHFKTRFYFRGDARQTAIDFPSGVGSLGVYRDFSIWSGSPSDTIKSARATARNGIFWRGDGGQGEIENIKCWRFNGFGHKFEDIFDTAVSNIITEDCGNTSEYAFSTVNASDTTNHCTFTRVQVELSVGKAMYLDGINNEFIEVHSERTTGDGVNFTHVFLGDNFIMGGRIEGGKNEKIRLGMNAGRCVNVKLVAPVTVDCPIAGYAPTVIDGGTMLSLTVEPSTQMKTLLRGVSIFGDVTIRALKCTTLESCVVTGNIAVLNRDSSLELSNDTRVDGVWSAAGHNAVVVRDCALKAMPASSTVNLFNTKISAAASLSANQVVTAYGGSFASVITLGANGCLLWGYGVTFEGALAGVPKSGYGVLDGACRARSTISANWWGVPTTTPAPLGGAWPKGTVRWNPLVNAGGSHYVVCTTSGDPGTWKAAPAIGT